MSDELNQTWGYAATGEAKIFDLAEGENLPEGWADTPAAYDAQPEPDDTRAAAVRQKGIDAATADKDRKVPPAYRGKPEEALWLEGFDSVKPHE